MRQLIALFGTFLCVTTSSGQTPSLELRWDTAMSPAPNTIEVPIWFSDDDPVANDIVSIVFSVDHAATLAFDPADSDSDGVPDAITINPVTVDPGYSLGVSYDAADTDGEIDIAMLHFAPIPVGLLDGEIMRITFTLAGISPECHVVSFSTSPNGPSFGTRFGTGRPGTWRTVHNTIYLTKGGGAADVLLWNPTNIDGQSVWLDLVSKQRLNAVWQGWFTGDPASLVAVPADPLTSIWIGCP